MLISESNIKGANLVDTAILSVPNRLTTAKAQSKWKRTIRSNVKNSLSRGVGTNTSTNKRQNSKYTRMNGMKKLREVMLENNMELETSLAEIGNEEPHRAL